ncbi:hypothetical protein GUJ93_ZPchr0013g35323, partial [Zizania palustris]
MAPTASMLFLSYHQLHRPAEAEAAPAAAADGRVRVSLISSALSLFARRTATEVTTPPPAAKRETGGEGMARRGAAAGKVVGQETEAAASLESRFEEALRFSC